jgi:hypothetical protein
VFDRGLHGGKKEPGYISSMESLFEFLKDNFGRRIDADFYLEMHEVACAHFDGEKTQTSDKSSIGKFRDQAVSAHFSEPHYTLTAKGAQEFNDLNFRLSRILGRTCLLGEFSKPKPNSSKLSYQKFSHEQIRILFNLFITEFYTEIDSAQSSDDYLRAIAKLVQCLEWLHPPLDGCGRVDTALLNFLLASYADLNPALLRCTYVSSCYGLDEWAQYLKDGMKEWKQACQEVNFRKKLKADRHQ